MSKRFLFLLPLLFAGTFTPLSAQVPTSFDLRPQLKMGSQILRDVELDLRVEILERTNGNDRVIYRESFGNIWTNYDGFVSLKVGDGTPTSGAWQDINWPAGNKRIRITGRSVNSIRDRHQQLYTGGLPTVAYAHMMNAYSRPGVGSVKLSSDSSHPNIEIFGNSPSTNYPYLDFATNASEDDRDYVARLRPGDDRNFYLLSRAGGLILRKTPMTTQISLYTRENAFVQLRGITPYIDFFPSNADGSQTNGRIILNSNSFELSTFGRQNILLNAGHNKEITYDASKHTFSGALEVTASRNFNNEEYMRYGSPDGSSVSNAASNLPFFILKDEDFEYANNKYRKFKYWRRGSNTNYSIVSTGRIRAVSFDAISDARVKRIYDLKIDSPLLRNLSSIKPIYYYYKDTIQHGTTPHLGFIAQDIEKKIPQAVSYSTDVIPDIFQNANSITYDSKLKTITFSLDRLPAKSLELGDRIKIIGKKNYILKISSIQGNSITLENWPEGQIDKFFVYGREVDDFRTVDYDQIFTLNVAATQALIKRTEDLQQQVKELQKANREIKLANKKLHRQVNGIEVKLEKLLAGNSSSPLPSAPLNKEKK